MASAPSTPSSASLSTPPDIDMGGTPTATLDAAHIDHTMAARLTIALLDHVLYMKGQVPFPVQSVARMAQHEAANSDGKSRTAKRMARKRSEFLQSYDDITSHLHTTFVALSTALAMNEAQYPLVQSSTSSSPARPSAKVYVMLILGTSPSSAKTRVLLELDGLHIERFGEWELSRRGEEGSDDDGSEDSLGDNSDEDIACDHTTDSYDASASFSSSHSPCTLSSMLARASFTPPTRTSPSQSLPSSPGSSRAESPPPSLSPTSGDAFSDIDTEDSADLDDRPADTSVIFSQRPEEAALRTGERLLSRALFAAGEGLGFGDEIPPTQAHIFLRAPRRLTHPTWIPRESLGGMLDRHVKRFLETESHDTRTDNASNKDVFGARVRTFGVRVACRDAEVVSGDIVGTRETSLRSEYASEQEAGHEERDEGDELIWWSWDGKLVGFAD